MLQFWSWSNFELIMAFQILHIYDVIQVGYFQPLTWLGLSNMLAYFFWDK